MDGLVLLNSEMTPLQYIPVAEGDFNIGDTFDFELKIPDTVEVQQNFYVALENSEFGGIIDRVKRDTGKRYITIGGRTWQGMLQETYNVVSYQSCDTNDLVEATAFMVEHRIPNIFKYGEKVIVPEKPITFRSRIYVLPAIREVYRRLGYRFHILFDPSINKPIIQVVPVTRYDDPENIRDTLNYSWQISNCPNFAIGQMKGGDLYAFLDIATGVVSRSDYRSGEDIRAMIKESSGDDEEENYQALVEALLEQYQDVKKIELYDIDAETFHLDDQISFYAGKNKYTASITSKSAVIQDGYIKYEVKAE